MTQAAFPYMRPAASVVRADVWMMKRGDELGEAPLYLEGWDYNTELRLSRELRADLAELRRQAGLPTRARLSLSVSVFSSLTWIRKQVFRRALTGDDEEVAIEIALPGEDLGGNVHLDTSIVLSVGAEVGTAFVARLAGSIIWSDRREIRLQGDAPLFPISVIDFERAALPVGAGWHLEIGPDLAAPLHASLRLYVNSSHSVVVAAFANAGAPRPEDTMVLRAVFTDVARVMVEHALIQEDLGSGTYWDEDSLGFALKNLLHRYFPHVDDLGAVRAHRIEHPSDFSTELLAKIGVF